MRISLSLPALLICLLLFFSCGKQRPGSIGSDKKSSLKYATHLKMWEEGDATFAQVFGDRDTVTPLATYIFPSDAEAAQGYSDRYPEAVVIAPGTGNLLVYSSVFSSALQELGAFDAIGSVADAAYFTDPAMRGRIDSGKIADVGSSNQPSAEKLLALQPSLALVSVFDGMDVSVLRQNNVPVAYMADNLEATPLGRAEWIKFLACIAGQKEKGDSIFTAVERSYNELKEMVKDVERRPKVMVENMYQGIWYVPGGRSYSALMLQDAGGDYPWASNTDNGSLSLSFEQVFEKASDADIWLLKLFGENLTASSLRNMDERNMLFAPVEKGGVWYSNTAISGLFDEFPYHPDKLLSDYIAIFHPQKMPGYTPRYFRRMEK